MRGVHFPHTPALHQCLILSFFTLAAFPVAWMFVGVQGERMTRMLRAELFENLMRQHVGFYDDEV